MLPPYTNRLRGRRRYPGGRHGRPRDQSVPASLASVAEPSGAEASGAPLLLDVLEVDAPPWPPELLLVVVKLPVDGAPYDDDAAIPEMELVPPPPPFPVACEAPP